MCSSDLVDFNAFPALVDSRDVHEHDEEQQHLPMYFSGFADVLDEVDDEQRRKRLAAGGMSSGTGSQRNASTAASYIAVPHGVAGEVAQVTPEISSDEATDARTNCKTIQADAQSNIFSDPGVLPRRPRFFNAGNVCTTICTALVALIFSIGAAGAHRDGRPAQPAQANVWTDVFRIMRAYKWSLLLVLISFLLCVGVGGSQSVHAEWALTSQNANSTLLTDSGCSRSYFCSAEYFTELRICAPTKIEGISGH